MYYLRLADSILEIETSEQFEIAENMKHFFVEQADDCPVAARYKVYIDKELQVIPEKVKYYSHNLLVFEKAFCEYRIHFFPGTNIPTAYSCETSSGIIEIHILEQTFPKYEMNLMFLETLALEKIFLMQDSLVLHSSYVIYKDKAILFSAPSGTGKSTQADLWKKYKGAEIINGDRSILKLTGNTVQSHGIPFCGSSKINLNKSAPLAGIFLIEQAPENTIEKCSPAQAIRKIYSECSINHWNPNSIETAFQIIEKIVNRVPVYQFKCNISEEAVNLVHRELFE